MFDFTKEVILNNLSSVSTLNPTQDPGVPVGQMALEIKRVNTYLSGNAGKVYRALGNNAVKEVVTITVPAGLTAGTYRLELALQATGAYPITLDRWAINKGKPVYVEFNIATTQTTADNFATTALPLIKRGLQKVNGAVIPEAVITKGTGTIVITAQNEYLRLSGSKITKLNATGEDFEDVGTTAVVTTPGKEGFGTAWTMMKNLRLPTQEATRFQGENQDETPIAGTLYNQYTFEYRAERNFTNQTAVGGISTSKTTHTFFVPQSLATAFEAFITTAFGASSILDNVTKAAVNGA